MGLISKTVEVLINNARQVVHFREMGYECYKGDTLIVPIEHLPKSSNVIRVDVECDGCGKLLHPVFGNYNLVMNKRGRYMCLNCGIKNGWKTMPKEEMDRIVKLREETNLKKYGYRYVAQVPSIQEKIVKTVYEKGEVRSSSQQKYIHELYGGELNGVVGRYNCDIVFSDEKICFEYDGRGHDLRVKLGAMSQEEFDKKEMIREKTIRSMGYKIIRFISKNTDKLPSDEILLKILELSKEYFNTTTHTWINWDIDESKYFNAEHQDGVLFNFGELRTLSRNNSCGTSVQCASTEMSKTKRKELSA